MSPSTAVWGSWRSKRGRRRRGSSIRRSNMVLNTDTFTGKSTCWSTKLSLENPRGGPKNFHLHWKIYMVQGFIFTSGEAAWCEARKSLSTLPSLRKMRYGGSTWTSRPHVFSSLECQRLIFESFKGEFGEVVMSPHGKFFTINFFKVKYFQRVPSWSSRPAPLLGSPGATSV